MKSTSFIKPILLITVASNIAMGQSIRDSFDNSKAVLSEPSQEYAAIAFSGGFSLMFLYGAIKVSHPELAAEIKSENQKAKELEAKLKISSPELVQAEKQVEEARNAIPDLKKFKEEKAELQKLSERLQGADSEKLRQIFANFGQDPAEYTQAVNAVNARVELALSQEVGKDLINSRKQALKDAEKNLAKIESTSTVGTLKLEAALKGAKAASSHYYWHAFRATAGRRLIMGTAGLGLAVFAGNQIYVVYENSNAAPRPATAKEANAYLDSVLK